VVVIAVLVAIAVGWLYEVAAIRWQWWPTITALVRAHRHIPLVALTVVMAVVGMGVWAIAHLLV